jgi:hypothetical protein
VNGRLYRAAFLLVSLPLLLLAFTVTRPLPLQKPLLPAAFDTVATLTLARDLATQYPDRIPGSAGALGAASWFADQLRPYGFTTASDRWRETVPGIGRVQLNNLTAVAGGQSPSVIVVMAHRDDTGSGPGANDNASGTAALIELARAYAQPHTEAQAAVQSAHTLVFLSTDGGAFGGLGANRFVSLSGYRQRIVAVINLDAIAGAGRPRIEFAGNRPRSPSPRLVATAVARIAGEAGHPPRHPGFFAQLVDLGFPFTLYEQGAFVAAGIPAVTLTTGADRPPAPFGDNAGSLNRTRLAQMGRAAQELLGSLNQGVELAQTSTSYLWVGGRIVRGWALELVLVALLVPFLVAIVDLYALCRRYRIAFRPALLALRSRLAFWFFAGLVFTCFRLVGAWPAGPALPPNPATPAAGDWPVWALIGFVSILACSWLLTRHRLVPRRRVTAEEQLAGHVVALVALGVVALLVVATSPFALVFVLPALHLWLWLPQLRIAQPPVRIALFAAGLAGPGLIGGSLAWRFGLGLDAPWYLLELVELRYVKGAAVVIALAGAAAAAQLASASAGRYAPYPGASERGPRGPVRELVRVFVLGARARRRHRAHARRTAAGSPPAR